MGHGTDALSCPAAESAGGTCAAVGERHARSAGAACRCATGQWPGAAVRDPAAASGTEQPDRQDDRPRQPRRPARADSSRECARRQVGPRRRRAHRHPRGRVGDSRRLGSRADVQRTAGHDALRGADRVERSRRLERRAAERPRGQPSSARRYGTADESPVRSSSDLRLEGRGLHGRARHRGGGHDDAVVLLAGGDRRVRRGGRWRAGDIRRLHHGRRSVDAGRQWRMADGARRAPAGEPVYARHRRRQCRHLGEPGVRRQQQRRSRGWITTSSASPACAG